MLIRYLAIGELGGIHPNLRYSLVDKGIALVRENKLDFLLGVGGVSDTAKAIAVGTGLECPLWDIYEKFNFEMYDPSFQVKRPVGKVIPFAIVMTKMGTGSEFDYTSVLSLRGTKEKLMIINKSIYAQFCIDDPTLTFTLPEDQAAFGDANIMTHFLDQYFSPTASSLVTDSIKKGMLRE